MNDEKVVVVMINDYIRAVKKKSNNVCYLEVVNHFDSGKTFKRYCFITLKDFDYISNLYNGNIK